MKKEKQGDLYQETNRGLSNNQPQGCNATDAWEAKEARMSFFRHPITNKRPEAMPVGLFEVYQMVRTNRYRLETEGLRQTEGHEAQRMFKGQHLDYVTPSGVFSYCSDQSLVRHSGILCMDLDDLGERVVELKQRLIDDPCFSTLLLFTSPRGNGLKWFIPIDLTRCDHKTWFTAVRNYLMATYGLTDKQVDKQCQNPSRACFLSHDPEAYLRTDLIEFF